MNETIDLFDAARFWSRVEVRKQAQCWPWRYGANVNGYGEFRSERDEKPVTEAAHRVAYKILHGFLPDGAVVRHKCDNPVCCNPYHLETGTHQDNVADRVARDRSARGEGNGRAKLTERDVRIIRKSPLSAETLARTFNVHPDTIEDVRKRDTWTHIE